MDFYVSTFLITTAVAINHHGSSNGTRKTKFSSSSSSAAAARKRKGGRDAIAEESAVAHRCYIISNNLESLTPSPS